MKMKRLLIFSALLLCSVSYPAIANWINYSSVSDALEHLQKAPSATVTKRQGWFIISLAENEGLAVWYFSPEHNAVRSAVFKKLIFEKNDGIETLMTSLCEASKLECEKATREFYEMNDQ